MLQRDLPLWARGVAVPLLLFASWWLENTESLRAVVGDSIAWLSLGIVAASILRGLGLPLALWPLGPWRKEFLMPVVLVLAVVFGAVIVAARPSPSGDLVARLDRGAFLTIIAGVLVWGFAWALVRQRSFVPWFGLAVGAAVIPVVVALVVLRLRDGAWSDLCWFSAGGSSEESRCEISVVRGFAFLAVTGVATALVTVELAFRRLLLGQSKRVGLALILGAAGVATAWFVLVVAGLSEFPWPLWLSVISSVGAGCFYVLSGSLLVSSLYTALLSGSYQALVYGDSTLGEVAGAMFSLGGVLSILSTAIVVALSVLVVRRNGLVRGIR